MCETDSAEIPTILAISLPFTPAALSSTTRARRTCAAGADGRATNFSKVFLSAALSFKSLLRFHAPFDEATLAKIELKSHAVH
jgi:hypothetical protein